MNTSYLRRLRSSGLKALLTDRASSRQCKKLVIDYSSPNIAKQFHIGNLRSTLIGRYVDKVHRAVGDDVTTVNYLGDWGTQFAMIATHWPQMRPSDSYWNSCGDVDKIRALTDCYVVANKKGKVDDGFREKVRETYAQMENSIVNEDFNSPTMQLWQDIRELSERHLNHFYSMLNIGFDRWEYESSQVSAARRLVSDMVKDKIARPTANGLWVVDLPGDELEEYAILRKSDSTTIYLSR
ncbi:putative arginine--tRNA ligase mitochondrial [Trichostrongylus colubriformis]|uniref:Probable arginine--tRNA ligase, mitochondrial n=1 Tax=Trichostrongylus colubriformis TaxID=6319 RepID=A0AAN8IMQ0_TRICO